jgi:metal-dependent amidase/aminoacylase/carboxypeptidase family protein
VVNRLQNIVSREVAPGKVAVVTVGSFQAGSAENIIPDFAQLGIDSRFVDEDTRQHILSGIKRIVNAESAASSAPRKPLIEPTRHLPMTDNDSCMARQLSREFAEYFKEAFDPDTPATTGDSVCFLVFRWH